MKTIINFLARLGFWSFVFLFTFLAIIISEFLMLLQSYWLRGDFFTKDLLIVGFITPAIDAFIVFTLAAYLIEYLKHVEKEKSDLSERLEEKSELLKSVMDENPNPIIVKDFQGKFLLANRACAELYQTTPEEMIGKDDGDFIPDKKQAEFFKYNVQSIMKSGKTQIVYEDSIDVKTGERRNYKSIKIPFKNSKNENQILVIALDITEERHKEEELRLMNEALDKVGEANFLVDRTGRILRVNDAAARDLGYTKEELTSMYVFDVNAEIQKEKWEEEFVRVKSLESSIIETKHTRKDGSVYIAEVSINYVEYQGAEYHLTFSRDITERKERQKELERMAHFDTLTNLPNRALLADRIELAMRQSIRRKNSISVAYIDLDGFKEVNDLYGHQAGDELLRAVSLQMSNFLRDGDTVARLGGDEFVALLVDVNDKNATISLLDRLLEAISKPIEVDGYEVQVSASIGVTFYPQDEYINSDQLIRQADKAMYEAKLLGKNRYLFFNDIKNSL